MGCLTSLTEYHSSTQERLRQLSTTPDIFSTYPISHVEPPSWQPPEAEQAIPSVENLPDIPCAADLPSRSQEASLEFSTQEVSFENLDILNRRAPRNDRNSLERYLSSASAEEGISESVIDTLQDSLDFYSPAPEGLGLSLSPVPLYSQTTWRPKSSSVVGSEQSFTSGQSDNSAISHRTSDSRGLRRGRRTWVSQHKDPFFEDLGRLDAHENVSVKAKSRQTANTGAYFCTWPNCARTFKHRSEWVRHEEAVHYCPYRWICCATSTNRSSENYCVWCPPQKFASCANREERDRTFYRQDQFQQHVKRSHCPHVGDTPHFKDACKSSNPDFDVRHLKCGYCGAVLQSWEERQKHVSGHMLEGVRKEAWRPEKFLLQEW